MPTRELQDIIDSLIEISNENGIDSLTSLDAWLPTLFKVYNKYHNTTDARILNGSERIWAHNNKYTNVSPRPPHLSIEYIRIDKYNDQALLIDAKNGCIETLETVLKEKDKTITYWQNYTGN